jgi:hypothetical protein
MQKRILLTFSAFVLFAFVAGAFYGVWTERRDWRNAREVVEKDLVRRGLDPQYLGPTGIIENQGQELTYAFGYENNGTKFDYSVRFAGPRGLELSVWDHARDEKR